MQEKHQPSTGDSGAVTTKPELLLTADGSPTLRWAHLDETYHSRHGAVQESLLVFIQRGLLHSFSTESLTILEVGFGTGLNALLTVRHAEGKSVHYISLETYPLPTDLYEALSYPEAGPDELLQHMHVVAWNEAVQILPHFLLEKRTDPIQQFSAPNGSIDLIYYDAFGPRTQPEMWTPEIFARLYDSLSEGGVLVTYCAKGQVRRDMESAGFVVQRLPGPIGKREMIRATKTKSVG